MGTPTFHMQPFGKCLSGITLFDENEFKSQFYLVDLSDSEAINKQLIFSIQDYDSVSDTNPVMETLENIILDWESMMMNDLDEGAQGKVRASASALHRIGPCSRLNQRSYLKEWKGVNDFDVNNLVILDKINEQGIGFVGGNMIMSDGNTVKIERGHGENLAMEDCVELPALERSQNPFLREKITVIAVPCDDVTNRKHSVNALQYNNKIFLFDLESGKFVGDKPVNFVCDIPNFTFSDPCNCCKLIPFLEGTRLRVFTLHSFRLYELVWKNGEITLLRHVDWMDKIFSVIRLDNFGLLIDTHKSDNTTCCFVYSPQPSNPGNSKEEGELRELSIPGNNFHLYSPISKTIVNNINNDFKKVITLTEIEQVVPAKIKELFNEEEYAEQLKKDMEFNTYTPKLITNALAHIKVPPGSRIKEAYQVKEERYNDVQIVAGLRCKDHLDKLAEVISEDYIELDPQDFGNYLGAPIMFKCSWGEKLEYCNYIRDVMDCRKSSLKIDVSSTGRGFNSSSSVDLRTIPFIGILSGKEISTPVVIKPQITPTDSSEEKEYEKLFKENEFRIESTSIIANDPLADGNGVLIENVRPGIWKWLITNKHRGYVDGGRVDPNLTAQIMAVHSDCYDQVTNAPNLWKVPEGTYRKLEQPSTKTDYYPDEVEGGWYVMKHGVGVDAGTASFFDQKYYDNLDGFELSVKPKSLLERSFKFSYGSEWSDLLSKQMQQANYPPKMSAPYGIITSSGYGDGCYACLFKKSQEGDVIAVRMIFD